jgi:hypothetical protein
MALIHDWAVTSRSANSAATAVPIKARAGLVDDVREKFWLWFAVHSDDIVIDRKVWLWRVRIRVRDLRPLFASIFGEPLVEVPTPGPVTA